MSRFLKLLGLAGGGLLAFGGGAVGTHYAQPLIEDQFYPERKQKESKLRQSFHNKSEQVDHLGRELNEQKKINGLQKANISSLGEELKTLNSNLSKKQKEIDGKDGEINKISDQIRTKEQENTKQKSEISTLQGDLQSKQRDLTNLTSEKQTIEGNLNSIKSRLALTNKDILKPKSLEFDLLKIDLRQIKFKNFDGNWATFEVTERNNTKVEFKVHKQNITNHENIALKIRETGILFKLPKDAIGNWDKTIKVTRFDADYGYKQTEESKKRYYIKNNDKHEQTLTMTDYFNDDYLEEAFKVYMAIAKLGYFSLEYDISKESNKTFYFHKESNVDDFFMKSEIAHIQGLGSETSKQQLFINTHVFNTIDDFIKYWIKQTVEYVRTGTVDFTDFLSPVNKSKYYKSNS